MSKKIIIEPGNEIAKNFINIVPASDFIPEWYRLSPSTVYDQISKSEWTRESSPSTIYREKSELLIDVPKATNSTYKKCTPFFDSLTAGYMVLLSADVEVARSDGDIPYIVYRTNQPIVTDHVDEQFRGLPIPKEYVQHVFKWENEFVIRTPKNYSLLFINPMNRLDLPFQTISGIVDTDLYNLEVNFPFFIKKDFTGIIKKGTPITQIIPIKRDSWKRKIIEYDRKKRNTQIRDFYSTIKRSYKNNYWFKKEYK
jgi:hypothetical protein